MKLYFLWTWFNFPAFLFHETCHLIATFLFYPFLNNVGVVTNTNINLKKAKYIITFNIKEKKLIVNMFGYINCNYNFIIIIIIIAPIIGWLIGIAFFIINKNYWVVLYFLICIFGSFNLSKTDKKSLSSYTPLFNNYI